MIFAIFYQLFVITTVIFKLDGAMVNMVPAFEQLFNLIPDHLNLTDLNIIFNIHMTFKMDGRIGQAPGVYMMYVLNIRHLLNE